MTDKQRTEYNRLYMRKKREERKEKGLCVCCGSYPAAEGRTKCEKCLAYNRKYNKARES